MSVKVQVEAKGMGFIRFCFLPVFIPGLGNNPSAAADSTLYGAAFGTR